ncbi:glycoside hydrolase family 31 protein [Halorubrum sp. RMP-47]|uniref:Glycoside hydrolase family 31 protein n=1 Tax=Halorubrum miltondacostae TaxID=3076378 RepID=A0ABD5M6E4_9EURY
MPFTVIDGVDSVEQTARGVILTCQLTRYELTHTRQREQLQESVERTVPLEITFLRPDVFQFELTATPETPTLGNDHVDTAAVTTAVDLTVTQGDDELVLETSALTVRIGTTAWSFSVTDATGRTIFAEHRPLAATKNDPAVWPLGFEEAQTSEWLYAVEKTGIGFDIRPDEHYYGLGEQFTALDKRGQATAAWVSQPHSTDNDRSYKSVPFYLSSYGYGLFVDTDAKTEFSFGGGSKSAVSGEITTHSDTLRFVFISGPEFDDILTTYTALTGRPSVPPKWSFGLWASRYSYKTQGDVEQVTRRLREENIPCDGIHLDISWMREGCLSDLEWDTDAFPDPAGLIETLHDNGYRLMLIEEPYLTAGSEAFQTALENGYLVADSAGQPYLLDRLVVSKHRGGILDFTNPAAVEWWQQKHQELLEMGVDGFWTDFGEYLPDDAILSNGQSGAQMRNQYPDLYQQTAADAMTAAGRTPLLWSRAGWMGTQRMPIHWGGDSDTTFRSLAATVRGGLSLALSGYGFWSHDIGGFSGTPTPELYIRWAQFGLLSSHARFHGTTPREPWEFGDEALAIFRKFARLRYRLIPYLYTNAVVTATTGLPLMRPLVLHYSDDPATRTIETQYLLGRDLLVAPVLTADSTVEVYLPAGEWINYWSDTRYTGQQTLQLDVPLDEVPLFVRAGSIIPSREPTQTVEQGPPDELELTARLADGQASGQYYNDAADTLTEITISVDAAVEVTVAGDLPQTCLTVTDVHTEPTQVTLINTATNTEIQLTADSWSYHGETLTVEIGPTVE